MGGGFSQPAPPPPPPSPPQPSPAQLAAQAAAQAAAARAAQEAAAEAKARTAAALAEAEHRQMAHAVAIGVTSNVRPPPSGPMKLPESYAQDPTIPHISIQFPNVPAVPYCPGKHGAIDSTHPAVLLNAGGITTLSYSPC